MQVVVLSGGKGSRLWPISNTESPKPFIKMEDGITLVRKTFIRASSIKQVKNIIVVTEHSYTLGIKSEYLKIANSKLPLKLHLILEPFGKDTAAAIASATLYINNMCGLDEMILVLPVDHLIADQNAFARALERAKSLAINGKIVTFGIKPQYPESAYGYIEVSGENVKNFIEKPSKALAQEYIKRGSFLWNSGILCFKAGTILQ